VVLAQNVRETTHTHTTLDAGVIYLGLGSLVPDASVRETVLGLLANPRLRSELAERLRSSVDGFGVERLAAEVRSLAIRPSDTRHGGSL
jgi:hypothetical protein